MGGQHRRGHLSAPGTPLLAQVVGVGAILSAVVTALAFVALSVAAAGDSPAQGSPGARPAAATASPTSSDSGPVTEPREATTEPGATSSATATAGPRSLPRTGAPSGSLLVGSVLALVVGVSCLAVGRELPFGRHEHVARPRHSATA